MTKKIEKKNWLEWLITIISGILVFFTLGFLIYQMIYDKQTPPNISIEIGQIIPKDGGFAMPVRVKNEGSTTAENVVIEVIANHEVGNKEKAALTFAFMPGKSESNGWVSFTSKPVEASIKTHVVGYTIP